MEVAFISGKGGTGKSCISSAFISIAKQVIAVDCDVDAANMYLIFPQTNKKESAYISGKHAFIDQSKCTQCGLCEQLCRFDAVKKVLGKIEIDTVSCDGCALCYRECPSNAIQMINSDKSKLYYGDFRNGKIIYGRLAPGEENSGKFVSVIRQYAKEQAEKNNIDTIILDGPPGIGCPVMSTITGVDKVVIITEPSMSGLSDMKRTIDVANEFVKDIYVIINKYDLNLDVVNVIKEYCSEMNINIIAYLPFDKQIVDAMIDGKTIIEYNSSSDIAKKINDAYQIVFNS